MSTVPRQRSRKNLVLAAAFVFLAGCTPADQLKACVGKITQPAPPTTAAPQPKPRCELLFHLEDHGDGYAPLGIPTGWATGLAEPVVGLHTAFDMNQWIAECKDVEPVPVVKITQAPNAPSQPRVEVYLRTSYGSPYIRWMIYRHAITSSAQFDQWYFFVHKLSGGYPQG